MTEVSLNSYFNSTVDCSGISDSRHSEIRTTSLQRTQFEGKHFLCIRSSNAFQTSREGNLLTEDNRGCPYLYSLIPLYSCVGYIQYKLHLTGI